jgi:hypothetical protein
MYRLAVQAIRLLVRPEQSRGAMKRGECSHLNQISEVLQ